MPMRIEELEYAHLEDAGRMFEAAYRTQRRDTPILDGAWGTAAAVIPKLTSCLESNYGVAAMDDGKLMGYMAGFRFGEFLGPHRGAYSPEWAHGSVGGNAFEIYRLMYRAMGQRWADDGCLTHAVNTMDHAGDAREALIWSGFGGICLDAVRPVERMDTVLPDGIRISLAVDKDIPALLPLEDASARHLAGAPVFIPYLEKGTVEELAESLGQPGNLAWIAWHGDEPAGYMRVTPVGNGAAWMVNGDRKFAINGAHVRPGHRGKGIATALLSGVMDWGSEQGMERCSVDFEVTNPEACRFWLRHFRPVCRSFVRRLDARILLNIE